MDFGTNYILITGASGWLGKTFLDSLLNGMEECNDLKNPQKNLNITCLLRPNENIGLIKNSENIDIVYGDITNFEDCNNFMEGKKNALLFHCAGIIHPKKIKRFYEVNVGGIENLLEASIKNGIKKIVAISSNSPCGTNPNNKHLFDENSDFNPYLNYGKSKMLMEKLIIKHSKIGNIQSTIIRPPWFYGPYQPQRQIRFYKMIKDGKVPIVGNGLNKRSMACTINISQAMIKAGMLQKANGNTYWIADKTSYTFNEIIDTIRKVMKYEFGFLCKNKHIKIPWIFGEIAYILDKTIQSFGFYNKEIHVLSEMNKTIACSIDKARIELDYKPTIDLYQGTYLSIKSCLEEFSS